ncbi:VOC family protein [Natronomonas sp.]|uniref:VOC family protein n=1 Tax=Natronomonas sp. TaxID=2184060 RepID=UPI003988AC5B
MDVLDNPDTNAGFEGAGTVHHVAFSVPDDETQDAWRETLTDEGLRVTPQKDRQYFRSIYFREPGGVLFEIATSRSRNSAPNSNCRRGWRPTARASRRTWRRCRPTSSRRCCRR